MQCILMIAAAGCTADVTPVDTLTSWDLANIQSPVFINKSDCNPEVNIYCPDCI